MPKGSQNCFWSNFKTNLIFYMYFPFCVFDLISLLFQSLTNTARGQLKLDMKKRKAYKGESLLSLNRSPPPLCVNPLKWKKTLEKLQDIQ